ncbi:MAG: DUF2802 domain-containing protein [Dyella sp.]
MWLEFGVIALLLLVLLQTLWLVLLWRQGRRLRADLIGQANAGGGVPALLVMSALNKMDHRLDQLELSVLRVEDQAVEVAAAAKQAPPRVVPMPVVHTPVAHHPTHNYELAQQLAREGAELAQLVERCGLSRNEAELVLRLYAGRA